MGLVSLRKLFGQLNKSLVRVFLAICSLLMMAQPALAVTEQRRDIERTPFYDKNAELVCGTNTSGSSVGIGSGGLTPGGSLYFLGDSIGEGMKPSLESLLSDYTVKVNADWARSILGAGGHLKTSGLQAVDGDAEFIKTSQAIVIELGTNPENNFAGKLDLLVQKIQSINSTAKIYLIDVAASPSKAAELGAAATNGAIYTKASQLGTSVISRFKLYYPNSDPQTYANLTPPAMHFDSLGVHSDTAGYQKLSELVKSSVTISSALATPNTTNPCQCPVAGQATNTNTTSIAGNDNVEKAFNFFISKGFTPQQSAGIVGNLIAESGVNPRIIQGGGESDNITVNNQTGYGIAQWTSSGRQQGLVDLARSRGMTIEGDLPLQLDYLMQELTTGYKSAYEALKTATTVREASSIFMLKFEGPADITESAQAGRAARGDQVIELYGNGVSTSAITASTSVCSSNPTGISSSAGSIVEIAFKELLAGASEANGQYLKYTDGNAYAWCASFVSWVLREGGKPFTGGAAGGWLIPGVDAVETWFRANNKFIDKTQTPQPGDIAIFNTASGAYPSHVVIVVAVDAQKGEMTTIGGNESNKISVHTHSLSASYLTGYGRP